MAHTRAATKSCQAFFVVLVLLLRKEGEKKDQGKQLLFAEKTVLGARNEDNKEGTFFLQKIPFWALWLKKTKEDILLQKIHMQF